MRVIKNGVSLYYPHPNPLPQKEGVAKVVIPSPFEGEGYDAREGGGRAKQEARAEDEGD